ncbi:MAG: 1-deoxy-D-xylulose-5-phosphate synthase [Clostridia bacterium]|nr:1-deoxy-D-xylulose-5-phosphate synthase [Clostridia bacterium]
MMNGYSQKELKSLSYDEARELAVRVREHLVSCVLETGGHLASNLGIVEISLGLLRVFSLPEDDIVYDTGHQSYVHKLLTDRADAFSTLRQYGGISGFPRRSESAFDAFGAGHSGTAVSAALGLARARILKNPTDQAQHTVAVLGDGALTNGMVYEALNNVRRDDNLVIVLNDNDMSISKSVGRLARYLSRVRKSEKYLSLKNKSHRVLDHIPLIGDPIERGLSRVKGSIKAMVYRENLVEQLGVYYLGPANGNDLEEVERLLREARRHRGPVLVHLTTKKGKGYLPAEQNPNKFHSVSAGGFAEKKMTFSRVFGETLTEISARDRRVVAITAAMESGTGLEAFHRKYPRRFFDVGISEEHAMTFAAGLSAGGLKPVFAVYSTFFQRAVDQLFHDLALQKLGALVALDRAGFADTDGPTHHGLFDVSLTLPIPNVQIFSPATYRELTHLMTASLLHFGEKTTVIRYPKGEEKPLISSRFPDTALLQRWDSGNGARVLILSYGRITEQALLAADRLMEAGVSSTVVKLTCLKPFDEKGLFDLLCGASYDLCYGLEEGVRTGGFFEGLFSRLSESEQRPLAKRFFVRAVEDEFVPHGKYSDLLRHTSLDAESVAREIASLL